MSQTSPKTANGHPTNDKPTKNQSKEQKKKNKAKKVRSMKITERKKDTYRYVYGNVGGRRLLWFVCNGRHLMMKWSATYSQRQIEIKELTEAAKYESNSIYFQFQFCDVVAVGFFLRWWRRFSLFGILFGRRILLWQLNEMQRNLCRFAALCVLLSL